MKTKWKSSVTAGIELQNQERIKHLYYQKIWEYWLRTSSNKDERNINTSEK